MNQLVDCPSCKDDLINATYCRYCDDKALVDIELDLLYKLGFRRLAGDVKYELYISKILKKDFGTVYIELIIVENKVSPQRVVFIPENNYISTRSSTGQIIEFLRNH